MRLQVRSALAEYTPSPPSRLLRLVADVGGLVEHMREVHTTCRRVAQVPVGTARIAETRLYFLQVYASITGVGWTWQRVCEVLVATNKAAKIDALRIRETATGGAGHRAEPQMQHKQLMQGAVGGAANTYIASTWLCKA